MNHKDAKQILKECGLDLVSVPAGEYPVGAGADVPLLAHPPQVDWIEPTATPAKRVTAPGFLITRDVVRLSHWRRLTDHGDLPGALPSLSGERLAGIAARRDKKKTVVVEPRASKAAYSAGEAKAERIPRQPVLDPVLALSAGEAEAVAGALDASLPRWYEWEIAARGPQGWLYPWGDEVDRDNLSLELQDYSVDEESVMGYYAYDQDVYFVHSFGAYVDRPSPLGLVGLARPGREWNLCHAGEPLAGEDVILRSISDLGGMAFMIPGIRPRTWSGGNDWHRTKKHLAYSGPALCCYASGSVGDGLYKEAGFRLVLRPAE